MLIEQTGDDTYPQNEEIEQDSPGAFRRMRVRALRPLCDQGEYGYLGSLPKDLDGLTEEDWRKRRLSKQAIARQRVETYRHLVALQRLKNLKDDDV